MRHLKKRRTLHRRRNLRRALLKHLASNLILRERMTTTEAKAKEVRPLVEKMITRAKRNTLADRRLLLAKLPAAAARKLNAEIAPKFQKRAGGCLRITKLPARRSDSSRMAVIEFVN